MKQVVQRILPVAMACLLYGGSGFAGEAAGIVRMEFDLGDHARNKEVRLWIPYPVSSRDQDISAIRVSGDFAESGVYTDRIYQTPILFARWAPGAQTRRLTLTFRAVRREVERRDFPAKDGPWDPRDYALWLAPTSLGPVDGPVAELAREVIRGKTTVLARGRDLVLNPPQQGPPLNTFGYPYAEVGGEPLDFYDPVSLQYTFTVYKELP